MKNFTRKGNWLSQSSSEIRWIYSFFLIFALVGHLSFLLISIYRVGPTYAAIIRHYRGEGEMAFPKEFLELLEVTHFHAYIEGIVLLVLAHLFVAAPISRRVKWGVIGLAFGCTFLDLLSPWLIRYSRPEAAYGQIFAWIGMGVGYIPLTFVPLYYLHGKNEDAASKGSRRHKEREHPPSKPPI